MDIMGSWDAAIAATISSGVIAAIAKAYISKIVENNETILEKVAEINTKLARIDVKLDQFDDAADLVSKHGLKIAAIEAKMYGNKRTGRSPLCTSD